MKTANVILSFVLGCGTFGCNPAPLASEAVKADDHAGEAVVFEATAVTGGLDAEGVSQKFRVSGGFARIGVMWDAHEPQSLELRTSTDGVRWSQWSRPVLSFSEEGAHVGRLDADATYYQYRVVQGTTAPSFVSLEPMRSIPEPMTGAPVDDEIAEAGIETLAQGITTPIGALTIHSRSDWNARAPRCSSATTPVRATIHHTVTPTSDSLTPQARLRQIQSYHMDTQGWCDIGYNYLVSRDGRVWRGRGAGTLGAHVSGANSGNVGISFMGTHTSTAATATQLCNTAKLLSQLHRDHPALGLTRTDVKGHRQYGSTECPGTALYNQIDDIIRKAAGGCGTP